MESKIVKHAKIELGLSNHAIALRLKYYGFNVSGEYVCLILNGEREAFDLRPAIADILQVPLAALVPDDFADSSTDEPKKPKRKQ